jgi:hypothetical protein
VSDVTFCPFVLEIFTLGITTGTTPTTYDPASPVSRVQMAAFLSRSVDGVLKRGSRRAALERFWTTQDAIALGIATVGANPSQLQSDGEDLWIANQGPGTVSRVHASSGKVLETWTGAISANSVLVTNWSVFVTASSNPNGKLYRIDPGQPAGAVTTVAINLGPGTHGIAYDGSRIWTANDNLGGVSIVTPGATIPWTVTTVTSGFNGPEGILYDGASIWTTDYGLGRLFKLGSNGAILQTVTVGGGPEFPVFDGTNIWVPNSNNPFSVSVVRTSNGAVLATLTGNGLNSPFTAAFDGQRILVTNFAGDSVSLWKAADLSPLGTFPTGTSTFPFGACSDGAGFFVSLLTAGKIVRF